MAAEAKLTAVIEAEDNASGVISKIGNNIGGFSKKVKDLQPVFKGMAVAGTVAFGAISAIAVSALKESAEAAADMAIATGTLQNSFNDLTKNQVAVLKKELGTTTVAFTQITAEMEKAGKAALKLGFDDEEASKAYSKLFQVTKSAKEAQRELTIAQDFARAKGISLTDATNKLIMVHSGATKALKAEGIQIDENATALENIASLEKTFAGQALNYANTTAGAWDIMTQSTNNLKQSIGDALAPALLKLLAAIQPLVDKFTDWASKNPDLLAKMILIGGAVAALVAVVGTLGVLLPSIIAGFTLLAGPLGIVVLIVATLIPLMMLIYQLWPEIVETVKTAFYNIGETILSFWTAFKTSFDTAFIWLKVYWNRLKQGFIDVWNGIRDAFIGAWNAIIAKAKDAFASIGKMLDPVIKTVNSLIDKLAQVGKSVGGGIKNFASNVVGGAKSVLGINDGIVQNGKVISTHPEDTIVAMKDFSKFGGAGININISGAVLTQDAAKVIGDMIVSQLRMQYKF